MDTLILQSFGINRNVYSPAKNLFFCRVSKIGNASIINHTGWGPQSIAFSCLKKVAEKSIVYGRYNELVHGGYIPG